MVFDFTDKVIWITGASSGIGEALAYQLSQRGAKLVLSARNTQKLMTVLRKCAHQEHHHILPLDLKENGQFDRVVEKVVEECGPVDIFINSGAVSQQAYSLETKADVEREIMEVNYWGAVNLAKAILPSMIQHGTGRLVMLSSVLGKVGIAGRSSYAASKHALHGYFDSLRADLKKQGHKDIKITMVCPGYVKTNISFNYLNEEGKRLNTMDKQHSHAMLPEQSASAIIKAIERDKLEVLVGGREVLAVYAKRFFQSLFLRNSHRY